MLVNFKKFLDCVAKYEKWLNSRLQKHTGYYAILLTEVKNGGFVV